MSFKDLMKSAADGATGLVKKEMEKKELEQLREQRILQHTFAPITIQSGSPQLGIVGPCVIRQRPDDGLVYFNMNEDVLFELIDYSWSGPVYNSVTTSRTVGSSSSQTVKKGKSGKILTGAIIGTAFGPIGTAVGAAIGAGGKGKATTQGTSISDTNQLTQKVEQPGTAVLKFRRVTDGCIIPITIMCNTSIDAKIKCFQFKKEQSASDVSKNTAEALKGIKALKELLDMGAISEEEFETKKKQILNI